MMTSDQLLAAFQNAGYDTPEKVTGLLEMANAQMTRNSLLLSIDELANKQKKNNAEIEAERQTLSAQVQTLTDKITAATKAAAQ